MKTINISKKKYADLTKVDLDKRIYNTEGIIYEFNQNGKQKIFKRLYNFEGSNFANKLFNIEMLNTYKEYLPNSFCIPDYLVSVNGTIVGFTLPRLNAFNLSTVLNDKNIDVKEKKYYLIKIGELLNQLKNIRKYSSLDTIYLNDLHESNIMVDKNNKEIKLIDLDSVRIINNSAFPSKYLRSGHFITDTNNKYILNTNNNNGYGYLIANENSDLLCYNLILLNYLFGDNIIRLTEDEFYFYLDYLYSLKIDTNLLDSFNRLKTNADNINPYMYLENVSDEQVYKANSKVYNYIKKK